MRLKKGTGGLGIDGLSDLTLKTQSIATVVTNKRICGSFTNFDDDDDDDDDEKMMMMIGSVDFFVLIRMTQPKSTCWCPLFLGLFQ